MAYSCNSLAYPTSRVAKKIRRRGMHIWSCGLDASSTCFMRLVAKDRSLHPSFSRFRWLGMP